MTARSIDFHASSGRVTLVASDPVTPEQAWQDLDERIKAAIAPLRDLLSTIFSEGRALMLAHSAVEADLLLIKARNELLNNKGRLSADLERELSALHARAEALASYVSAAVAADPGRRQSAALEALKG